MTDYPLFKEIARNSDPVTSHERADKLTKTPKLTKMILLVLECVKDHPNYTARDLGQFLYGCIDYGVCNNTDVVEWPHKVMLRLVNVGWVRREDCNGGMKCFITETGKSILERTGK